MAMLSSFRELTVWKEAHKLVLMVYKATEHFPKGEQYGLVSQMRRAAVSVPANIVEGFKRRGRQEKIRFYNIAEASLEELKYFSFSPWTCNTSHATANSSIKPTPSAAYFIAL
jgi:four helix bundle protein